MPTIAKLLEEGLKLGGGRRALFDENTVITYPEVRERADKIAGFIQGKGLERGDMVAIAMPRCMDYIIVETACLLYGFGALLLDAAYPADRIAYCVENSGSKLVFDEALLKEALSSDAVPTKTEVTDETSAIAIYTSGSTGQPKGVLHDQKSIGLYIERLLALTETSKEFVIGAVAPFTFVAHLGETIKGLCMGASATLISRETVMNPIELAEFIDRHQITHTYLPPKLAKLFHKKGNSLVEVYTASEPVRNVAPDGYRLYNMYGMSETNVVLAFRIDKAYDNTPVGTDVQGCKSYVLNENNEPCEEGELCVAGYFFTEYIGMPEKTAQTKVKNPFFEEDGHEYMIRTGDIVRRLPDGNILYVNRKDWMVKINGQRVEPGEVEHAIREVKGVRDAAVKGFEENGMTFLCAFYVAEDGVSEEDILSSISKKLPAYMIPERMARMETLPLNANGKLDRMSLKPPAPKTACVAPDTDEERLALSLAKGILTDIEFGVTDDLDRLGMDSMRSMEFSVALKNAGLDITTSAVMKYRNIRAILSNSSMMMYFVEDYDAAKPTLVMTSGIVVLRPVLPFYRNLSRSYNILLIEPVQDHYEKKLKGLAYDELVTLYMEQILRTAPDPDRIIGFMGFSFGGEISASLACRFEALFGRKTFAILGDTVVKKESEYKDREIKKEDLPESVVSGMKEKLEYFLYRLNIINGFGYGRKYACYDGPVALIDAGIGYTEAEEKAKLENAKARYADLTVVPMKQYTHSDLFRVMDLLPFYERLIEDMRKR